MVTKKTPMKKPAKKVTKKAVRVNPARIAFILDRSGSMDTIWRDTLKALNGFIKEQGALEAPTTFTLIAFDHEYNVLCDKVDINDVKPITNDNISPRGSTALYDAVGKTINDLGPAPKGTDTIIVVLTDGFENSSKEFTLDSIKKTIAGAKKKQWQLVFLGADLTVLKQSDTMGYTVSQTIGYQGISGISGYSGVAGAMYLTSSAVADYRTGLTASVDLVKKQEEAEEK